MSEELLSEEIIKKQYKIVESKNSNKLGLDKYYTSEEDMNYCVNKTLDVLRENGYSVDSFLEPSAGAGVFSDYLATTGKEVIALDIYPEGNNILKQDYLTFEVEYKKNRLVIGNPPFGSRLSLAKKFYNKSTEIADYISFILPISQLNNTNFLYRFDLIHSEDLGELVFSGDRKVKCCLNIYVRPEGGLNNRNSNKLKDIEIVREDSKKYADFEYDIRMCYWGNAGKILKEDEKYSAEYKIKIHNTDLKKEIELALLNCDWKEELNPTVMLKIQQHHIYTMLKKKVVGIK